MECVVASRLKLAGRVGNNIKLSHVRGMGEL
jgi:hypothetical protein